MNTSDSNSGTRLNRARWLATTVGIALAGTAAAAPQLLTIEECLESGTRAVSLPGAAIGTLVASPCTGCPALRLRFDARSVYLIGKQAVTYAKFREAAVKDDLQLDVYYQPKTLVLTRLRVPATGNGK